MGIESSRRLGMGNCKFRMVDWYWPRWDPDFRYFVFAKAEMEDIHQPRLRGYDYFRGDVCWYFPGGSRRPYLV